MSRSSYTLIAFGTGQTYGKGEEDFLKKFYDACSAPNIAAEVAQSASRSQKSYCDGPGLAGFEVEGHTQTEFDNIIKWLNGIEELGVTNLNLTGFSRGAVTCIRIANRLNAHRNSLEAKPDKSPEENALLSKLKKLDINLFLVDPVAGYMAKSDPEASVIPGNVTRCISILQLHEMRRDFKAQTLGYLHVEDPSKTDFTELPMYGNHSDSTKEKNAKMDSAPHILWGMLYPYLSAHGTEFNNGVVPDMAEYKAKGTPWDKNITPKNLLNEFGRHHAQEDAYEAYGRRRNPVDSLPTLRTPRKINQHLECYVRDSDFFINKFERELFKISYPKTFNYLFEMNRFDLRSPSTSASTKEVVLAEILEMQRESPELFNYLVKKNKIGQVDLSENSLGNPSGTPLLESLSVVEKIYPDEFPCNLEEPIKLNEAIKAIDVLTQSIVSATFCYQKDKAFHDVFKKKSEDAKAEEIRNKVLEIVKKGCDLGLGSDAVFAHNAVKVEILDHIEKEAFTLRMQGSQSKLADSLDDILEQNGRSKTSAPENQATLTLIRAGFKVIDEAIYALGTGGFIVGGVLSAVGILLKDIGDGIEQSLPKKSGNNENPRGIRENIFLKIATGFIGVGTIFKNHSGIATLREGARSKLKEGRDAVLASVVAKSDLIQGVSSSPKSVAFFGLPADNTRASCGQKFGISQSLMGGAA